jgi:hypothetical protein
MTYLYLLSTLVHELSILCLCRAFAAGLLTMIYLLCCYEYVLLHAESFVCRNSCVLSCVPFCLWTMPLSRSREPVLVHCDREFALPWP